MTSKQTDGEWYANRNFVMAGDYAGEGEPDVMVEVQIAEDPASLAAHIAKCVESHDALIAACEATDKALTDIQALMRKMGWKIEETDTLDFQLYSALAEVAYKAHAALSKAKEVNPGG